MPGKTPANRPGKESANSSGELSNAKSNVYKIWPKWNDDEIITEKKESAKGGGEARARKGTAFAGNVEIESNTEDGILPPSLKEGTIDWVKPGLFITAPMTPVVVAEPIPEEIDLSSQNKHLLKSELMCSIISQLQSLWHSRGSPLLATGAPDGEKREWRLWDHIQHCKEHQVPLLNPHGTYGVKIFWMGTWRKITVTHHLPLRKTAEPENDREKEGAIESVSEGGDEKESFAETRELLLPRTANTCELWPAILTKAILKVAALDSKTGREWKEYGDCSVIHMFTGWCPQTLTTRVESDTLWGILCQSLPLWKRPCDTLEEYSGDNRGEEEQKEEEKVENEPAASQEKELEQEMEGGSRLIIGQFTTAANGQPMTRAKEALMANAVAILKENRVVSENFDPHKDHPQCIFVRQVRDIPLKAPPKEPPPIPAPEEHAWLGYSMRRHEPWKGPPPKPHPPRWVELLTPFSAAERPRVPSSTHSLEEEKHTVEGSGEVEQSEGEVEVNLQDGEGQREDGSVWMKFEEFRKAFSSVEVFTAPVQYKFTQSYRDMSATVEMVTQEETKGKGRASHSPANKSKDTDSSVADDTKIIFMEQSGDGDSSSEAQLHCVFSCLSNWREGPKDLKTERKKSMALQRRKQSILSNPLHQRYSFTQSLARKNVGLKPSGYAIANSGPAPFTIPEADEDSSVGSSVNVLPAALCDMGEDGEGEEAEPERVVPGVLLVEEFDWKSVRSGTPLLRLVTSGVKGSIVKVDTRKRMFRIHAKSPVGYHLSIASDTHFVLFSESSAYDRMHKEGIGFSKVYSGSIPPLQPNSWTVLFREVLHVRRDGQLLAFRLDCPVPGHQLRVVDNDDGIEMPRVANITEPQEYCINKKGYTLLCEVWTRSEPVVEGKCWRLRLISSHEALPLCEGLEKEDKDEEEQEKEEESEKTVAEVAIATEFYLKEVRDYCLPDRDMVMLRYSLRAKKECPVTIQLTTSKTDAHISLEVFDGGELVAATQGRAYCFIPALCLLPTSTDDSETEHKYVMVASITHNSWPKEQTAWIYIDDIKLAEEEKSVTPGAAAGTGGGGGKGKKPPSASAKGGGKAKKAKGGGKDGGKDSSDGVQSSSSLTNIDSSKPHWTLRVVTRLEDREQIEIGKDTEREDELKSMQTTWETQQPGRLKKGQESRQKFLDAHRVKNPPNTSEDQSTVAPSSASSSTVQLPAASDSLSLLHQPPHTPVPLERIDLSLYTKHSHATPHVLTAEEREQRDEERKEMIRQYRAWRQSILESRDEDRQFRNEEKLRQLEEAEKLQIELERTRKRMNKGREKIRQVHLAEEKARREAELAALKAAEEEAAANSARDSKAKGKKGKKK